MQRGADREVQQRRRIGDDTEMRADGSTIRLSGEYEIIEDRWMPTWLEIDTDGYDEPDVHGRVELRDGMPQLVELSWKARPGQREIRAKHLREVEVSALAEDLYAGFVFYVDHAEKIVHVPIPEDDGEEPGAYLAARKFVEQQRASSGNRRITDELLRRVAEIYRDNVDHAPTAAVARTFGVKARMASTYVQKARERGYLPPTRQGKKNA